MDIKEALKRRDLNAGDDVELSGWLVDTNDGLYILGDHFPEDFLYPHRIRVENGNIIYPILDKIPALAGGYSCLFYKSKAIGVLAAPVLSKPEVTVQKIFIEGNRDSGLYEEVNINPEIVEKFVRSYGDYKFNRPRNPMRDWLEDE